jgi:hypothetical protein
MVISIGMSIIIIQKLPATSTEFLNFVLRHKRQFNTPRFLEQAINIFLSCFSMYVKPCTYRDFRLSMISQLDYFPS